MVLRGDIVAVPPIDVEAEHALRRADVEPRVARVRHAHLSG